jgi:hypothetical protein
MEAIDCDAFLRKAQRATRRAGNRFFVAVGLSKSDWFLANDTAFIGNESPGSHRGDRWSVDHASSAVKQSTLDCLVGLSAIVRQLCNDG